MILALLLAQTAPVATPSPVPAPVDKPICREAQIPTGSMLPAKRVCRTRREWAAIDAANRRSVDRYADDLSSTSRGH